MSAAAEHLDRALLQWGRGEHYEAHESLEEWVEEELEGVDLEIGLAMIHIAAALHKHVNRVSPEGVPGKLASALAALSKAPGDWRGLDVAALRAEVERMARGLERREPIGELPVLRRAARAG